MSRRIFPIFLILMMTSTIFICFESYSVKAAGNTLYVGGNGPGNYTTIQSAINAANPGDTVFVYSGIYYENVLINKTINLFGENKDITIINASQIKDTIIISADNVNLTGFTITGSGKEWRYVNPEKTSLRYLDTGIIVSGKDNVISNNIIIDNGVGLKITNKCLIMNNLIADNYDDGICIFGDAHGTHIVNNFITSNGIDEEANQADGIGVENCPSVEILNNTISENQVDGIWSDTSDGMKIIGNTIYGNKNDGINLLEGSSCNISYNKIYNHITGGFFVQPFSSGINLRSGRKNIIFHNYIYHNNFGISYQVIMNDEIYQNSINDNTCGMWMSTSTLINIHDNDMRNNRLTIGLWCSNALEVHKNNLISSRTLVLLTWYSTSNFMNNYWGAPSPLFRTLRIPYRTLLKTVIVRPASLYEFIIDLDD